MSAEWWTAFPYTEVPDMLKHHASSVSAQPQYTYKWLYNLWHLVRALRVSFLMLRNTTDFLGVKLLPSKNTSSNQPDLRIQPYPLLVSLQCSWWELNKLTKKTIKLTSNTGQFNLMANVFSHSTVLTKNGILLKSAMDWAHYAMRHSFNKLWSATSNNFIMYIHCKWIIIWILCLNWIFGHTYRT